MNLLLSPPAESGIVTTSPPELISIETPELALRDPNWGRRLVSGVYTGGKDVVEARLDYPVVGYNKAWKNAINILGSVGKHSDASEALVAVGNDFSYRYGDGAPAALGVVISWSVARQISQPFLLQIDVEGFENVGARLSIDTAQTGDASFSPDRHFTLFLCSGLNGGRIYVPFAQRITPSMQIAMPVIATPAADLDGPVVNQGLVQISNVPAGMVAEFGASVQLMTAHSLSLAQFARRAGIFTEAPVAATVCGVGG